MARDVDEFEADAGAMAVNDGDDDDDAAIGDALTLFLAELDALEHFDERLVGFAADATSRDVDTASAVASTDIVAGPNASKPPPRKRKRKRNRAGAVNTFWKRQKEELASLHGGVEVLQTQLELLQHQREHRRAKSASHSSGGDCKREREQPLNAKEQEAKKQVLREELAELKKRVAREMKARQQAKLKNAKLRKLAEETLQMKRSMEDAFAKHPLPSMSDLVDVCPAIRVSDSIDAQTYLELERCLDARYAGMDLVKEGFGRCPEGNSPSNLRVINLLVKSEHDTSVLLDNSRVIPFPVKLINDVVEQSKKLETLQTKDTAIKVVKRFESTVFMMKQYTIHDSDDKEVVIMFQSVFKRYFDGQRMFMAWESIGEWPGKAADGTVGFAIREHGWGSAQPFPDPANRSSASTLRASIIVAPDVLPGGAYEESLQRAQAKLLSDTVVPTHQLAFASRMQQLENLLLDHSIRSRCE